MSALLVETTAAGFGEGAVAAPARNDLDGSNSGSGRQLMPPEAMVKLAESALKPGQCAPWRRLALLGFGEGLSRLFNDADGSTTDGTSKREALRQWHMGVVRPLARMLSAELSEKFGTPVRLQFDNYPMDMVSRAQVVSKLAAVEGISPEVALAIAQIGDGHDY